MKAEDRAKERFFTDTKEHTMAVLQDNGLYRHLVFSNNGSCVYRFGITTWPGHLCIYGDMGCFVFSRVQDMFRFFRGDRINPSYWAEKLQAICRHGHEEYSEENFLEAVKYDFEQWEFESEEQKEELWEEVKDQVLKYSDEGEEAAINRALNFDGSNVYGHSDGGLHRFEDFWEHNLKEYTFHYIWCLYAIVHAIKEYDEYVENARDLAKEVSQLTGDCCATCLNCLGGEKGIGCVCNNPQLSMCSSNIQEARRKQGQ